MSFGDHIGQRSAWTNPGKSVEKLQSAAVPQRPLRPVKILRDVLEEAMSLWLVLETGVIISKSLLKDADASRLAKTRPTAAYFGQVRAGSQVSNPEVQGQWKSRIIAW